MNNSRVPIIYNNPTEQSITNWVNQLDDNGVLFNVDDDPVDVINLKSGEQIFSILECGIINETIQDIMNENLYEHLQNEVMKKLHK